MSGNMIEMNTRVKINQNALQMQVASASKRAIYKASALAMKMARQKIRYRSYKVSSVPGSSPFKHSKGRNSFSHSIRFAVDSAATTALIGPQRENKAVNPSGPIPRTLEFGGRTRRGPNTMWFQQKNVPWNANTEAQIAAFFRRQGWGPLFMGTSPSTIQKRLGGGRILSAKRAPSFSRGSSHEYKMVYYLATRIISDRQAARAARNVVKHFGYPAVAASTIAARPYMGPTLQENENKILQFWQEII